MILRDAAIVLRFYPVTNTSRMAVWMTENYGRVTTLIKGSQRPRSAFIGQYDLFYNCELLFYARVRSGDVHILREVSAEKRRDRLRQDWRAAAAASYFSDLLFRVTVPRAPRPELFELLDQGLDELAASGWLPGLMIWYELTLLRHLGLQPQLDHCVICRAEIEGHARFAVGRGGLICEFCRDQVQERNVLMRPTTLGQLRDWAECREPDAASMRRVNPGELKEMQVVLGHFLRFHLEHRLQSRNLALELLQRLAVEKIAQNPAS